MMNKSLLSLFLTFPMVMSGMFLLTIHGNESLEKRCYSECSAVKKSDCNKIKKVAPEFIKARKDYRSTGDREGYYHPTGSYWYQELLNLSLKMEQKKRFLQSLCPKTMMKEKD